MANALADLRTKIFADGADLSSMLELYANPVVKGFTTNPTLMRKTGIDDYELFAKEVLASIPDRPISFEVFADEFAGMRQQARQIASWGSNVYVKIPITTTSGESSRDLIADLAHDGVKVNVTALMTPEQVSHVAPALEGGPPAYISVFAGRVADTGRDPVPLMKECLEVLDRHPGVELIWASPRELLNVFQADDIGCHVITVTHDVLKKLALVGKDLLEYSLETVRMFHEDGRGAGYELLGLGT